jgi:surfactin synthase thioesterase subunit
MDSIPEPADRITASLTSHHDHPLALGDAEMADELRRVGGTGPRFLDDVVAWQQPTDGPFEFKVFSGGRVSLDAHQQGVVDAVSKALAQIAGEREPARGAQ